MDDIIWVTYRGRHIPIKPGMRGKFKKKEYELKEKRKLASEEEEENRTNTLKNPDNAELKEKHKELQTKLENLQDKMNKSNNDETYIESGDRKVKVTGLNTDYNDDKNSELANEERVLRTQLGEVENEIKKSYRKDKGYATLSEYEEYFLSMGYSKATALKYAKEEIAKRKRK